MYSVTSCGRDPRPRRDWSSGVWLGPGTSCGRVWTDWNLTPPLAGTFPPGPLGAFVSVGPSHRIPARWRTRLWGSTTLRRETSHLKKQESLISVQQLVPTAHHHEQWINSSPCSSVLTLESNRAAFCSWGAPGPTSTVGAPVDPPPYMSDSLFPLTTRIHPPLCPDPSCGCSLFFVLLKKALKVSNLKRSSLSCWTLSRLLT